MPGVIDADTHVLEHEAMWEDFDEGGAMYPYRPLLIVLPPDTSWGGRNAFWLIDGEMYPKAAGQLTFPAHTPTMAKFELERTDISLGSRQMSDVSDRLKDMDQRGVHIQIVFPTLFLFLGIQLLDLEIAVCHAYNKFMAEACHRSEGRLRFVATLPFKSVEASLQEMNYAKEQRAAGLFFRSSEAERALGDQYFEPIYQEANRLNLPVCIHTGSARFTAAGPAVPGLQSAANAFTSLVTQRVPERYPDLRFGFVEFGSMWLPEAVQKIRRGARSAYRGPSGSTTGSGRTARADPQLLKDYRIYVACFTDDALPYVLSFSGDDNVLAGSDYAHQDPSHESHMVEDMRTHEDVDRAAIEKILCENPQNFYAL